VAADTAPLANHDRGKGATRHPASRLGLEKTPWNQCVVTFVEITLDNLRAMNRRRGLSLA
jgi:hypothetical protein